MMRWLAMMLVVASGLMGALWAQEGGEVTHTKDTIEQVRENIESGKALFIDVREMEEWEAGHLPTAKFVPLSMLRELPQGTEQIDGVAKEKILYVHCRSGRRCLTATPFLKAMGYDVRPLQWGYEDLVEAGF